MSIIVTKKQVKRILEWLGDDGDDLTEIKIREAEIHDKPGVLVSFPEYDEDGEFSIER